MRFQHWAAFIGLGVIWGSSFFWNKLALQEIGPFTLVVARVMLGLIGMLVGMVIRRPKLPETRRQWLMMGLLGLTNTAIPFSLIAWSQQHIDSTVVSILVSSVPIFTVILAHFLVREERLFPKKFLGVVVGFLGVVVLFWRGLSSVGEMTMAGQFGVLGAAVFYAISPIIAQKETSKLDPLIQSFVSLAVANVFMWAVVMIAEPAFRLPTEPTTWGALLWLGLVGSALAYHIYYFLIGEIGSTRVSMIAYLMPVVGLVLGVLLLREDFDMQLLAGSVLVLGSIWVVNRVKG